MGPEGPFYTNEDNELRLQTFLKKSAELLCFRESLQTCPTSAGMAKRTAETAMRRGEILNVQREHLPVDKRHVRIPKTKIGIPRTIPLSPTACDLVQIRVSGMRADEVRLFPISPNAFRLALERTKKRAGINDLHFHDLRHEAISRLFEQGLAVAHVAAISGHKDFRILAVRHEHLNSHATSASVVLR